MTRYNVGARIIGHKPVTPRTDNRMTIEELEAVWPTKPWRLIPWPEWCPVWLGQSGRTEETNAS